MTTAKRDAVWNLIGSLVYAGCQWGVLVATVKLSNAAEVGRLSLGFAVTAPIFLLLHLRLRAASATDSASDYTRGDYVTLRVACTVLAMLVTLVVCQVAHLPAEAMKIVLWVAVAKAIESGSDLVYGLSQQAEDLKAVALSMSARGVLAVSAFGYLLVRTHTLSIAMSGLCAAWGLVFLVLDLPRLRKIPETGQWSWKMVGRLVWLTLPLGVSTMFMSLTANMPRYFIQHQLGIRALGIFSAAGYLTMTGSVVISAIAESSLARMSRLLAAGTYAEAAGILRRVRDVTLTLSAVLVAGSVLAGRQILSFVYKAEYGDARVLLIVMMLAAAAANMASVYGYALIAARRFNTYLWTLVAAAACTGLACAVLIPHWGTVGAALSCLIAYGLQFGLSWGFMRSSLAPAIVPALERRAVVEAEA